MMILDLEEQGFENNCDDIQFAYLCKKIARNYDEN